MPPALSSRLSSSHSCNSKGHLPELLDSDVSTNTAASSSVYSSQGVIVLIRSTAPSSLSTPPCLLLIPPASPPELHFSSSPTTKLPQSSLPSLDGSPCTGLIICCLGITIASRLHSPSDLRAPPRTSIASFSLITWSLNRCFCFRRPRDPNLSSPEKFNLFIAVGLRRPIITQLISLLFLHDFPLQAHCLFSHLPSV